MHKSESDRKFTSEPIALVGSSCRFPGGASSPSKLWELLRRPRDVLSEIPPSRFNTAGRYHPDSQHHGSTNVRHAYLLEEDPRAFDCDFFSINPREAESMDPQQRMLLETVYEGIESAGYSIAQLRGSATAVFVGVAFLDYQSVCVRGLESLPQYHATGVAMSVLANRISYFYDWKGPSVAMDTACSSSMVALHNAVQTLRNGEADMAVVIGSSLILGPEPFVSGSNLNMLSPNGRSYMWDKDADGYTRGEGFSAVILKKLSTASSDGDHIECIIRETGVNQDGRTTGITMPSSTAQAALMAATYARAGLDLTRESDRPQYFEAHGTGTQAGDPREAEAISDVFFANGYKGERELLVGSIKTIIGHHGGGAGLASIIKASLILQHGQIAANLHFHTLNPAVQPFYHRLRIPTEAEPWPALVDGCPRRVSVNSFGFGGTNGHAILVSWPQHDERKGARSHSARLFVLSANSAQALAVRGTQLRDYLRSHPEVDMGRLARTLFHRADFPFRAAFSATTTQQLAAKLESATLGKTTRAMIIPPSLPVRILGIFTGQGAQWPTMGAELHQSSDVFRNAFRCMQQSLDSLPEKRDRPSWRLLDELCAPAAESRMGDASISQPLCTALQVALVDMFRAAGMQLAGVVAHSSGEVAAAYAAGYIGAHDAIRIAYLRGLHSHLARGPDGEAGMMMAVGMSQDQATSFCAEFGNTINVAASNSTRSCTLAGHASTIHEAQKQLESVGVFARLLQVDKAYHSNHMLPVAQPYLESLEKCDITVLNDPEGRCPWYSSVWGSGGRSRSFTEQDEAATLKGQYWADNMIKPVLFSDAVQRAIDEGHVYDFVLEFGPHPALKGPVSETITNMTAVSLPYSGLLTRGQSDVEAFNDALGLLWKSFNVQGTCSSVAYDNVQRAFATCEEHVRRPALLKDLPSYAFNHDTIYWRESRASALFRTQDQARHQLLGHSTMFGSDGRREVHWRQVLRLAEMPWLCGHKIQGEYLFPAMGYVTMAYEAAVRLVPATRTLKLMELRDIDIFRAINLQPDSSGTEILFTMNVTDQSDDTISGRWACYSAPADVERGYGPADVPAQANAHAEGVVHLVIGSPRRDVLPQRIKPGLSLSPIDVEELYETLAAIGHEYAGHFRASAVLRRLNYAVVSFPPSWKESELLTRPDMNPAALDAALHGILAAYSYPGDGRQRSVYLPRHIESMRISMTPLSQKTDAPDYELKADCFLTHSDAKEISGDLNVFDATGGETRIQLRGVHLSALPGSQLHDRGLYAQEIWDRDAQFGIEPELEACVTADRVEVGEMAARLVLLYCTRLVAQIKPFETMLMSKNRRNLIEWVSKDLLTNTRAGVYFGTKSAWLDDASQGALDRDIHCSGADGSADVALLHALGSNLPSICRGLSAAVKVAEKDDALGRFFADGVGFREVIRNTASLAAQLSHRYPRMEIAEIGCSFGPGLRRAVLNSIGKRRYKSYTVTNGLTPADEELRVISRPLDMAKDPVQQGFSEAMYDLLIATTSYSTNISEETLGHARKLLRAGGMLILVAMTADYLPVRFVLSLLPGSWLENDNGKPQVVGVPDCDVMLKAAGFSGVDWSSSSSFCSIMLSQGLDESVAAVRDPTSLTQRVGVEILVVHDSTLSNSVKRLLSEVNQRLERVATVRAIAGLDDIYVPTGSVVLSLCDLDSPVLSMMTESRFQGLQAVMRHAGVLLWVTTGAQNGRVPENSMVLGWSRSARLERSSLKMQILDVAQEVGTLKADTVVKLLLSLANSHDDDQENMWTVEPELLLKKDALYIPRVWPVDQMNLRSGSRWKEISAEVAATSQFISLDERGQLTFGRPYNDDAHISNWEILASSAHRFLLQGEQEAKRFCIIRNPASGETRLVLTSPAAVHAEAMGTELVWRRDGDCDDAQAVKYSHRLYHLLRLAIAEAILAHVSGRVWVHGAAAWLAQELALVAQRRSDIELQQTTSSDDKCDENIMFLHPFAMERDTVLAIPVGASTFLCLDDTPQGDTLVNLVRKYRPAMKVESVNLSPESRSSIIYRNLAGSTLASLAQVLSLRDDHSVHLPTEGCIIAVQDIPKINLAVAPPAAVFDRTTVSTVTAKLLPPSHAGLFRADKTYLLVGLAGEFGVSISDWMFSNGARHVVLASRNPHVSQCVVDHATTFHGASLRTMAVDICHGPSLAAAWAEIHASMPPVAGIMHGAMVMHDQLFVDQPWADFSAVLGPKVTGTRNLAALLEQEAASSAQLDFVLLFSSAVAIAGNAGQTAYAASGCFMQGMANELQRRGVKAAVLHIGPVRGLGYLHRQDRRKEMEQSIHKVYAAIGEVDLHDMLAEAIAAAARPPAQGPAAIMTGIGGDISTYSWRDQPRLWHYLKSDEDGSEATGQLDGAASLKAQLAAVAGDEMACLELLLRHFGLALCSMLHMKPEELETATPVANLGIDSLVAVRVREWFMHHVGVEVSVLKVMSANITQLELCRDVLGTWRNQN